VLVRCIWWIDNVMCLFRDDRLYFLLKGGLLFNSILCFWKCCLRISWNLNYDYFEVVYWLCIILFLFRGIMGIYIGDVKYTGF
jgi:hypothetical protein